MKNRQFTKKGPGRRHRQGKPIDKEAAAEAAFRLATAAVPKHKSLVGQNPRRVWLGGISAQRGF